jgi:flagellar biosynthetic protein FliR
VGLSFNALWLIAFLLALVRAAAWMIAMPAFSDLKVIPPTALAGTAAGLAVLAAPSIPTSMLPTDTPGLIGAIVLQALTGLAMGYVVNLLFQSFTAAGAVLDLAGGLNLPGAIDPLSLNQTPMIGQFYQQVALLLLFGTGGYLDIVAGFIHSFSLRGFSLQATSTVATVAIADLSTLFTSSLEMAGPILLVLFATQIALALLSRAAPQVNVFLLGMPLQVFLTLSLVAVSVSVFPSFLTGVVQHALNDAGVLFKGH